MKTLAIVALSIVIAGALFVAWVLCGEARIGDDKEEQSRDHQRLIEREEAEEKERERDFPSRWHEE